MTRHRQKFLDSIKFNPPAEPIYCFTSFILTQLYSTKSKRASVQLESAATESREKLSFSELQKKQREEQRKSELEREEKQIIREEKQVRRILNKIKFQKFINLRGIRNSELKTYHLFAAYGNGTRRKGKREI